MRNLIRTSQLYGSIWNTWGIWDLRVPLFFSQSSRDSFKMLRQFYVKRLNVITKIHASNLKVWVSEHSQIRHFSVGVVIPEQYHNSLREIVSVDPSHKKEQNYLRPSCILWASSNCFLQTIFATKETGVKSNSNLGNVILGQNVQFKWAALNKTTTSVTSDNKQLRVTLRDTKTAPTTREPNQAE